MALTDAARVEREATLTGRTLSGLRWSYIAAAASAVVQFGYVAAMSRLLSPTAFGLMAIANIAVSFGFYFSRMGVAQALIQRPVITQREIRAATTSGWITGSACTLILWLVAPRIAEIFDEPDVIPLLRVMGVSFLLSGLAMTSQGLLRRDMRFRALSKVQMVSAVVGATVGLGLAIAGAGVWSLVYSALAGTAVQVVMQYRLVRHPVRPLFRVREFVELYRFGIKISVIRLGEFAGKNLDTIAVGYVASTASLGLYNRAFFLVNLPVSKYLSNALSTVLFPGFSRLQGDQERVRRVHLSVTRLAAVILLPVCAGMAVAGPEIVRVALGEQWVDAIPLVPFFALAAALNIMSKLSELLAEARDELNRVIGLQFGYLVILVAFLVVAGLSGGPTWVFAAALAAGEGVRQLAYLRLMRRVTGATFTESLQAYIPAVFAAAVVSVAVGGARWTLLPVLPPLPLLLVQMAAGALGLVIGIRFSPSVAVRRDLRGRLRGAGVIGPGHPGATRVVGVLVGAGAPARSRAGGRPD